MPLHLRRVRRMSGINTLHDDIRRATAIELDASSHHYYYLHGFLVDNISHYSLYQPYFATHRVRPNISISHNGESKVQIQPPHYFSLFRAEFQFRHLLFYHARFTSMPERFHVSIKMPAVLVRRRCHFTTRHLARRTAAAPRP